MKPPLQISSFRLRLLLLLAALLGLTLLVQYFVNLRSVKRNTELLAEQEQAIMAGVALGVNSISSTKYLDELRNTLKAPLLDEHSGRVKNVLVVDQNGDILDSLIAEYTPRTDAKGAPLYIPIEKVALPPLSRVVESADEGQTRPRWLVASATAAPAEAGAFYFSVDTTNGPRYVIVVLNSARTLQGILERQSFRSLLGTLVLLLATTLVTGIVVWRFTRPIKELSIAARRVASGDFTFRVTANRHDEIGELAAAFNDMTAELGRTRQLESQLHQAEKAAVVGRLASAIAHEIRNPLNYINLTLDHLRAAFAPEDAGKRATFERLATQLKTEVARINSHISNFLSYSRPSRLDLQPLNLRAETEDALRLIEVQANESGIDTRIEEDGEVPEVMADREALRSVLTNLMINSLQAIDGEGGGLSIKLSADPASQQARVEISDTGRGIAAEDIGKVFEPYYSTKETGTGLGLAIVKKIVDDHGGTITVRSKPGDGTTFTVSLPSRTKKG